MDTNELKRVYEITTMSLEQLKVEEHKIIDEFKKELNKEVMTRQTLHDLFRKAMVVDYCLGLESSKEIFSKK